MNGINEQKLTRQRDIAQEIIDQDIIDRIRIIIETTRITKDPPPPARAPICYRIPLLLLVALTAILSF